MDLKPIRKEFKIVYGYSCFFTDKLFDRDNNTLSALIRPDGQDFKFQVLFAVDSGVAAAHPALAQEIEAYCAFHNLNHAKINVQGGEACKNDRVHLEYVLQAINDYKVCRHSFVVAIGGGALLDLVGYAASIAHRGVRLIRVPTTVLAQNDAGIGVKNGINRFDKKNFTGTFAVPVAVINDRSFLKTLDYRDWVAGIAEAVKVSLLKDPEFFNSIEREAPLLRGRDGHAMTRLIHRCAALHMDHIAAGGDPFESGSSRPLDFGHWSAHKLEQLTQYRIRHGEAVAVGLAIDCTYAHLSGLLDSTSLQRILDTLSNVGFKLKIPVEEKIMVSSLLDGIDEFREHLGGELTITLIEGIGRKKDVHTIHRPIMEKAIKHWVN